VFELIIFGFIITCFSAAPVLIT